MDTLALESSAVGDYDDSVDRPGSSFLWFGDHHHLNREEVSELVGFLQHWLDTGRLAGPKDENAVECAEGDLLGEALGVLGDLVSAENSAAPWEPTARIAVVMETAQALLAKAKEKP